MLVVIKSGFRRVFGGFRDSGLRVHKAQGFESLSPKP